MKVTDNIRVSFNYGRQYAGDTPKGKAIMVPTSTKCFIEIDKSFFVGRSVCKSPDNFSYDEGRKKALKSAVAKTSLSKADRTLVWEAYRNATPTPRW